MIIHEDTPRWWKMREKEMPREGIFRDHSCAYCQDGAKPCRQGSPSQCEYPHARND
jgi:hypothetical protein